MGTKVSIADITAAYTSATKINAAFDTLADEFDNCLSLDGTSPNQMLADFDLNSNDILNGGTLNATDIVIAGTSLATQVSAAAASAAAAAASETAAAASAATAAALSEFTSLTDTPSSYAGHSGKFVTVKGTEDGLEFGVSGAFNLVDDTTPQLGGALDINGYFIYAAVNNNVEIQTTGTGDIVLNSGRRVLVTGDIKHYTQNCGIDFSDGGSEQLDFFTNNVVRMNLNDSGLLLGEANARVTTIYDEDTMSSNSATALATQQSIKAYVDTQVASVSTPAFESALLHLQDVKSSGTAGGTFNSGAWRQRTLNTEVTDEITSTLSSNTFTLPNGTYWIEAEVPASDVAGHIARLYNVTDAAAVLYGTSARANTQADNTPSLIRGRFTVAGGPDTFQIEDYCTSTSATTGFGYPITIAGISERYTDVRIWKVA